MLKERLTSPRTKDAFADIARAHRLRLIVLYGSVARGAETAMSDIDIGVLGHSPLSHEDEAVIAEEMARVTALPRIEVKSLHRTPPLFLYEVMNEGVVLFADSPTRAQGLRLYAWKMAVETRHMREERYAQTKKRIEAYVR